MDLKKRLLLTNLSLLVIPPAATVLMSALFLYAASLFSGGAITYTDFERALRLRYELFTAAETVWSQTPEALAREEFVQYLDARLDDLSAEILVEKGGLSLYATDGLRLSDVELPDREGASTPALSTRTVIVGGTRYVLQSQPVTFQDGASGTVYILAAAGRGTGTAEAFLLFALAAFLLSGVVTILVYSARTSQNLAVPLVRLNETVAALSEGNLDQSVVEQGDEEIRQVQRSLEKMRVKMQEAVANRQKVDESRRMLVSSISHDLKTPMTAILGYVEGLRDGVADTPEKQIRYLETVRVKAELVDRMIDDLVYFSKLELDQVPYDFETTDPSEYLAACIEENREGFRRDRMEFTLEDRLPSGTEFRIDRGRMKRVFQNLFENARKYRKGDSGSISVVLRESTDRVLVEVRDEGIGIPKDSMPYIFDRFYRADGSRGTVGGSGLGLSIARQIVEDHQGRIWVRSEQGEGSTFVVALPRVTGSERPQGTADREAER
jgi:signal transduction histidine kinase